MNSQSFDKACKEKLISISGENYIPDWENFSQKLGSSNSASNVIEDTVFDQFVSEKLNQLPQASAPMHIFNQVYQDFVHGQWRRHHIYLIKFCEMIAVILLLITFKNHFISERLPSEGLHDLSAYASVNKHARNIKKPHTVAEKSAFSTRIKQPGISKVKQPVSMSRNHSNEGLRVFYSLHRNPQPLHFKNEIAEDSTLASTPDGTDLLHGIIQKLNENLNEVHSEHAEIFPLVLSEIVKSTELTYEFSLGTGINAYQINTPFDRVYSIASYRRETMSSVVSAGIGMTSDRWSVLSGLQYSRLYYRPEIVSESYNMQPELFFETSLKSIQYDLIQIPLKLRYAMLQSSRAGFYAEAGISTHLIWDASYDVATYVRSGRPSVRFVEETPRLEDKNFTPGISKNLLLKDNYFSGLIIGLGGDMKIWNNIKIYGQISYSRHFIGDKLGVGPNDDRIHYASGQAGFRWTIR